MISSGPMKAPPIPQPIPTGSMPIPDFPVWPETPEQIRAKIDALVQSLIDACPNCGRERASAQASEMLCQLAKKSEDEMFVRLNNKIINWSQEAVNDQKRQAYSMIAQDLNLGLPAGYVVTAEIILERLQAKKP